MILYERKSERFRIKVDAMPIRIFFRLFIVVISAFAVCLLFSARNEREGTSKENITETAKDALVISTTKALTTEQQSTVQTADSLDFDTYIILDDEKTTINGEGANFQEGRLTITKGGRYSIKGTLTDGNILVDSKDKKKVKLVLSGVDVTSSTKAPFLVENSHRETIIILEKDTVNTFSDGSIMPSLKEMSATIHSQSALRIDGKGTLAVNANWGKGIYCKSLDIRNEAVVSVTSVGDAIKAEGDVAVSGGTLDIVSGGGATGANFEETTEESSEIKPTIFEEYDLRPGEKNFDNSSDGIFAKNSVVISGGRVNLDCAGRGITAKTIVYSGGLLSVCSDRSALSASDNVLVSGGEINITNTFKGIESDKIFISGGKLLLKTENESLFPADSLQSYQLLMSGGYVIINSNNAQNSNGKAMLSGGTFIAFTPGSFKTDFTVSGGMLFLVGDENFGERITATGDIELRSFNGKQKGNQFYAIVEEGEDEAIIGFSGSREFSSLTIATEEIDGDEQYNLYQGGTFHGRTLYGVYIDCDYDYGTLIGALS